MDDTAMLSAMSGMKTMLSILIPTVHEAIACTGWLKRARMKNSAKTAADQFRRCRADGMPMWTTLRIIAGDSGHRRLKLSLSGERESLHRARPVATVLPASAEQAIPRMPSPGTGQLPTTVSYSPELQ